jgi:hypothetical protein
MSSAASAACGTVYAVDNGKTAGPELSGAPRRTFGLTLSDPLPPSSHRAHDGGNTVVYFGFFPGHLKMSMHDAEQVQRPAFPAILARSVDVSEDPGVEKDRRSAQIAD